MVCAFQEYQERRVHSIQLCCQTQVDRSRAVSFFLFSINKIKFTQRYFFCPKLYPYKSTHKKIPYSLTHTHPTLLPVNTHSMSCSIPRKKNSFSSFFPIHFPCDQLFYVLFVCKAINNFILFFSSGLNCPW